MPKDLPSHEDYQALENKIVGIPSLDLKLEDWTLEEYQLPEFYQPPTPDGTPACCVHCANLPANGGSGICCCTLPYMTQSVPDPTLWFHWENSTS